MRVLQDFYRRKKEGIMLSTILRDDCFKKREVERKREKEKEKERACVYVSKSYSIFS